MTMSWMVVAIVAVFLVGLAVLGEVFRVVVRVVMWMDERGWIRLDYGKYDKKPKKG
jgi:uncharacterized protein (UPF0548 family)